MSLSAFIRDHHEEIISEFAVFARTLMPPRADMTDAELRDHASAGFLQHPAVGAATAL